MSTRAATPAGLRKKGRSSVEDDAGVSCVNARAEGASVASLAAVAAASGLAGMAFASPAAAGGAEKVRSINRARAIARALAHGFELRLMCFPPPGGNGAHLLKPARTMRSLRRTAATVMPRTA